MLPFVGIETFRTSLGFKVFYKKQEQGSKTVQCSSVLSKLQHLNLIETQTMYREFPKHTVVTTRLSVYRKQLEYELEKVFWATVLAWLIFKYIKFKEILVLKFGKKTLSQQFVD